MPQEEEIIDSCGPPPFYANEGGPTIILQYNPYCKMTQKDTISEGKKPRSPNAQTRATSSHSSCLNSPGPFINDLSKLEGWPGYPTDPKKDGITSTNRVFMPKNRSSKASFFKMERAARIDLCALLCLALSDKDTDKIRGVSV
jgi:hypothetical protein